MRPKGSAEELFHRRQRGIELLKQGLSQIEVARRVDANVRTVRRWHRAWREGGEAALRPKPVPGVPSKLTDAQRDALAQALSAGPEAAGFDGALWTGRRIAALIKKRFGVSYHERYVLALVRTLGFTPQRPERGAREHNPREKARWLYWQWPALKKKRPTKGRVAGFPR